MTIAHLIIFRRRGSLRTPESGALAPREIRAPAHLGVGGARLPVGRVVHRSPTRSIFDVMPEIDPKLANIINITCALEVDRRW
jgi:hypothetical protein